MRYTQERRLPRDPHDWTGWWRPYLRPWPWLLAIAPALSYAIGTGSTIVFAVVAAFMGLMTLVLPGHPMITLATYPVLLFLRDVPDRLSSSSAGQDPAFVIDTYRQWVETWAVALLVGQALVITWALIARRRPDPVLTITRNR